MTSLNQAPAHQLATPCARSQTTDEAALLDNAPWDVDGDKLREECGIFGVIGARSASSMVALGLHALQ
ncbi:hypothetical protein NL352_28360, partial [Klebsiella pneumoniae]|nr:hypothetical protein [Klebsiella pneumoniae]